MNMARAASLILFLYLGSTLGYNIKVFGNILKNRVRKHANTIGIYEGTSLNIKDAPYMALYRPPLESFYCGASIISEKFLVTAAHCVEPWGPMHVTVGTANVNEGRNYEIDNTFVHPNYSQTENDIALIKLTESLDFNDRIRPIKLAEPDFKFKHGDVVTAIGFGEMENGNYSTTLLSVNLPYVNQMLCKILYTLNHERITDTMFCSGLDGKYSGTCQGDSGGPVVFKNTLVGVTSWGIGCGSLLLPDVSTRVSSFRSFIDDTIKNNS